MNRWLSAVLSLALLAAPVIATAIAAFAPTTALAADDEFWIDIELGKSQMLPLPQNATFVGLTDPEIARIQTTDRPNLYQVQGLSVGSTDLTVQLAGASTPLRYEITVHQDLSELVRRIDAIVEGEPPRVYPLKDHIVVQGSVPDLDTLERVTQVATVFDEDFVNLMTVRGDHQVQLEVVFAQVTRAGLRDLGVNLFFGFDDTANGNYPGISLFQRGPNTNLSTFIADDEGNVVLPAASAGGFDFFGISTIVRGLSVGAYLSILDDYKLSKVLAQPTLVALSGQQAEFLNGGEVPIPAPAGQGAIMVQFREYGVKLSFVPTVLAEDVIDLRVYVELSEVDFSVGSRITGIEIPGFASRKARSHVRLDSGMTFAMAGLLSEETQYSRAQIPLLGDIPILGALFRYVRHEREETELVIFVTPRLVRPLGAGEVPAPPGTTEDNNPTDLEFFLLGMDHRGGSRQAQPTGAVGLQR